MTMHHFEAKGGTYFNFNSDMSGDVHIHRDRMIAAVVSGFDLLEFARWYAVEYAGVRDPEPLPNAERPGIDCSRCGKRLASGGYCTLACSSAQRGEASAAEATRDLYTGATLTPPAEALARIARRDRPRPAARDVAHEIIDKTGWRPNPAISLTEAADAIVAIIRADRKGGE